MSETNLSTSLNSLRTLSKVLLAKMENKKWVEFNPKSRGALQEEFFKHLQKSILTEEDLTRMVREQVSQVSDQISEQNITETDAFKSQKKVLRSKFEDHAIQGFYLKKSLRDVCKDVCHFLLNAPLVEDVFESDEQISKLVQETVSQFDESKVSL